MAKRTQCLQLALLFFIGAVIVSCCSAQTTAADTAASLPLPLPATTVVCATPAIPYVYSKVMRVG